MTDYTYLANLADLIPDTPEDSIVSRTIYKDDQVRVIMFSFAAGEELSEHTAAMPAQLYFVKGEAKLTLGEDTMDAVPGTWTHMPPNLPHSIEAKTPVVMLLTMFGNANS